MFLRCFYYFQNLSLDVLINKVLIQSNACSCDGCDLNTSENSKGSYTRNSRGLLNFRSRHKTADSNKILTSDKNSNFCDWSGRTTILARVIVMTETIPSRTKDELVNNNNNHNNNNCNNMFQRRRRRRRKE